MADPMRQLLAELVAERFAPAARPASSRAAAAEPDSPEVVAERQRVLCAALDGPHLVAVKATQEAA